ncbi:hypothetical protein [Streptomyces sp. NPDC060366]|uniref:hypothetical protein n=1 Tax=Streptomyces sp. NPDC060366 TaxID=3347105 RepID=UPI00365A5253
MRTVCAQCGTRHEDWDHGGPAEEDAYGVSVQLCIGCQVIAEKQAELAKDGDTHGKKIGLIPVAVQAAMEVERDEKKKQRLKRDRDND